MSDPDLTQPTAAELLNYEQVLTRLDEISQSPRALVRSVGTSHEGRAIPMVLVSDEQGIQCIDENTSLARKLSDSDGPMLVGGSRTGGSATRHELPDHWRLPVLFAGAAFGDEASHVEALLRLTELLMSGVENHQDDPLGRLLVLVIPLMNPDGRARALEEWESTPGSSGSSGEGNHYGQLLNRDFVYTTQPETQAVARVLREYRPFLVWDTHEDALSLGRKFTQTCLAPPTGPSSPPGLEDSFQEIARIFGREIHEAWQAEGFDVLFQEDGEHGWTAPEPGKPARMTGYNGRLVYRSGLSGIPAFITESARTPGTITWEERNRQKVVAGLRIASVAAKRREWLVPQVQGIRKRSRERGADSQQNFLLPTSQDQSVLKEAVRILGANEVAVYRAPGTDEYLFVPGEQASYPAIQVLLGGEFALHDSLASTIGLEVLRSTQFEKAERDRWQKFSLAPIGYPPMMHLPQARSRHLVREHALKVSNSVGGIRAIVGALREMGCEVRWQVTGPEADGEFLLKSLFSPIQIQQHLEKLGVRSERAATVEWQQAMPLRMPRIGVYVGQGTDLRQGPSAGSIRWALEEMGFAYAQLDEVDLAQCAPLAHLDVLIVPNGDADAILNGWDRANVRYGPPWELPGEPHGLGDVGLKAIREFVYKGGTYLGIDSGGGWLATADYLGLAEFEVASTGLGLGCVRVALEEGDSPLLAGLGKRSPIRVLYGAEPHSTKGGGSAFRATDDTCVLARYVQVAQADQPGTIISPDQLTTSGANVAIVSSQFGSGKAYIVGFDPTFRCQWMSTFPLVSNACFESVLLDSRG